MNKGNELAIMRVTQVSITRASKNSWTVNKQAHLELWLVVLDQVYRLECRFHVRHCVNHI